MAGNLDDFLSLALKQKRDVEEAQAKRQAAALQAGEKAAAARTELEQQTQDLWGAVAAQIEAQVDAINEKSAVLDLVAEIEDRFVVGAVLASRAVHFQRKTGFGRITLSVQVARSGIIQYRFDKKNIFSGKIAQMKPKDHETIMGKILAFVVACMAKAASRSAQPVEGSRAQVWQAAAKAS
jgi:hypothetical protein